jgi:hypothetical protein
MGAVGSYYLGPQCTGSDDDRAFLKYSQALAAGDVWKMKLISSRPEQDEDASRLEQDEDEDEDEDGPEDGCKAIVGFATKAYDPKRHREDTSGIAQLILEDGTTFIYPGISVNGKQHARGCLLYRYIPDTATYWLALRIDKNGNVPQVQFNEDGVWHDFSKAGRAEGRAAVNAGPWFPYLQLCAGDRLVEHCFVLEHRPKPRKSAAMTGMKRKSAPAGEGEADDDAGVTHTPGGAPGDVSDATVDSPQTLKNKCSVLHEHQNAARAPECSGKASTSSAVTANDAASAAAPRTQRQ